MKSKLCESCGEIGKSYQVTTPREIVLLNRCNNCKPTIDGINILEVEVYG